MRKRSLCFMLSIMLIGSCVSTHTLSAKTLKIKNLSSSAITLPVGSNMSLSTNYSAKKLTFSSSKKAIASINEKGIISAHKTGKAIITLKTKNKKTSKKIILSVQKPKAYTIDTLSGTYQDEVAVTLKAKRGYKIYYSTNSKLKKKQVILSGKSQTFTFSETTTLTICAVKKNTTFAKAKKKAVFYSYVIAKSETIPPVTTNVLTTETVSTQKPVVSTTQAVSSTTETSATTQVACSTTQTSATTQAASSTTQNRTTTQVASSTTQNRTTTQAANTATEISATTQAVSSTTQTSATTQAVSSTTQNKATTQAVSSTTQNRTTTQAVSSTTQTSATTQTASSTTQNRTTTQAASSTTQNRTTTQAASSTTQNRTTTQAVSSTTQNRTTTQAASSTTQNRTTTQAASSTTQNRTTTQAVSSTTQNSATTQAASSTTQNRATTQAASSTTQNSATTQAVSSTTETSSTTQAASSTTETRITTQVPDATTQATSSTTETSATTQTANTTTETSATTQVPDTTTESTTTTPVSSNLLAEVNHASVVPENLGVPTALTQKYGTNYYARNIWDMAVIDGKVLIGTGDYDKNTAPTPIFYFTNDSTDTFTTNFETTSSTALNTEAVKRFIISNGTLYTLATDPQDWPSCASYYEYDSAQNLWLNHQTLPKAIHVYDMVEFDNKIFFGTMVHSPSSSNTIVSCVQVLDKSQFGTSSQGTSLDFYAADGTTKFSNTNMNGSYWRVYDMFVYKNELYAVHTKTTAPSTHNGLFKYDKERNAFIQVYDGNALQGIAAVANYRTGTTYYKAEGSDTWQTVSCHYDFATNEECYEDLKVGIESIYDEPTFAAKFSVGDTFVAVHNGIFKSNDITTFELLSLGEGYENYVTRDAFELDGKYYFLASQMTAANQYTTAIFETDADFSKFREVLHFETNSFARSFAYNDGYIYVGLGSNSYGSTTGYSQYSGTIMRINLSDYIAD